MAEKEVEKVDWEPEEAIVVRGEGRGREGGELEEGKGKRVRGGDHGKLRESAYCIATILFDSV